MRPRFTLSLRTVLLIGFVGLVLVSTGSVLAISAWSGGSNTHALMLQRSAAVLHGLEAWVTQQLRPLEAVARNAQAAAERGDLDLSESAEVDAYVRGLMAGNPQLEGLAIVTPDHQARRYGRDGAPQLEDWAARTSVAAMVDDMLARAAMGETGPVWGHPVWRGRAGHGAFHVRIVLKQDGAVRAVLFAMTGLKPIAPALPRLLSTDVMTPYVLYDRTRVLAHPLLDAGAALDVDAGESSADDPRALPSLDDVPDARLAPLWTAPPGPMRGPVDLQPGWARRLVLPDAEVIHTLREVKGLAPAPLLVGTHFTIQAGASAYVRLWQGIVAGLAVLAASVVAAVLVSRWIGRPVLRFAALARAVAAGDLSRTVEPGHSLIREYQDGGVALQQMVKGLRERERVRSLFGKYVPEEVARRLLAQGEEARAEETEATVLVADLVAFTDLTQVLGPERVVSVLNAYFSEMVGILEDHGGVVTQFQGDAMLVVFNLPESHPDHATAAVLAALAMQRRLDSGPVDGRALACRIGIGTGLVLAGSVGASDRLSYTVHGDAVNLAARLEAMNKTVGTRILVSGRTADLATSIPFESLGALPVRGHRGETRVFTPREDGAWAAPARAPSPAPAPAS